MHDGTAALVGTIRPATKAWKESRRTDINPNVRAAAGKPDAALTALAQRLADLERELDAYPPLATIEGMRQRLADANAQASENFDAAMDEKEKVADLKEILNDQHQALAAAEARAERAEAKVADVTEKWVHMSNRYMEVYIEKERAEAALRAWLEWYDSGYRGHQPARLALDSRTVLAPTEEPEHETP